MNTHPTVSALIVADQNLKTVEGSIASLEAQRQAFADESNGTLDLKLLARAAAVNAGFPIFEIVKKRRKTELLTAYHIAARHLGTVWNQASALWGAIDAAIIQRILDDAGSALKGAVSPRQAPVFKAEQCARLPISSGCDYIEASSSADAMKSAAASLLESIGRCEQEIQRSTVVAKKYNINVTAGALVAA